MATRHRRVNVTCDPELIRAMSAARAHGVAGSDSALLRALALKGASTLPAGPPPLTCVGAVSHGRLRHEEYAPDAWRS